MPTTSSATLTCPWCGTHYVAFQSNCKNCGGPMPLPAAATGPSNAVTPALPVPPPAPRAFADSYVWRLVFSDGWALAGSIFGILGTVFLCIGLPLIVTIVGAPVGIIFALLGSVFLLIGGVAITRRYQTAQTTLNVLRHGAVAYGQIIDLTRDFSVSVNHEHPWIIRYQCEVNGQLVAGQVITMNTPGPQLQVGQPAAVLYAPNAPQNNTLYPHP
ncbi:MAG: hypothetical protein JNL09_05105 [Anaerolineales bacterium]|nr:hypothetical protein [Anaerolineales bacterium]